jgi:hypothetical protein
MIKTWHPGHSFISLPHTADHDISHAAVGSYVTLSFGQPKCLPCTTLAPTRINIFMLQIQLGLFYKSISVSSYFFRGLFNDAIRMTDSTVLNVRVNNETKNWKGFAKQGYRLIEVLSRDLPWGAGANNEILRPETVGVQAKTLIGNLPNIWQCCLYTSAEQTFGTRIYSREKGNVCRPRYD